jgi:mannan endo-1,4-beta-mannosidase
MNEPRCVDDQGRSVPGGVDTLTQWIEEMSAYVKSLDQNHLTCVGDEGFFNTTEARANALYSGLYGVDCERILSVDTVDFGTCHLYPSFDPTEDAITFGQRWIREHIEAGQRANKPMLVEEYGYATNSDDDQLQERNNVFGSWLSQVLRSNGSGAALWMIASVMDDGQLYSDYDHYTVYSAEDVPAILSFSQAAGIGPVE